MVECSPATRAARVRFPDDAINFADGQTSPGFLFLVKSTEQLLQTDADKRKAKTFGDGGYRSPYLSHAKRALYHLSYVPIVGSARLPAQLYPVLYEQVSEPTSP